MKIYTLLFKCDNGHESRLEMHGMTEEMVKDYAQLIDGSSPMYVYSPIGDPKSSIGKCNICGAQFTCSISGSCDTN